jgi:hypothetical protein
MICKLCGEFCEDTDLNGYCILCTHSETKKLVAYDNLTSEEIHVLDNKTNLFCHEWIEKNNGKFNGELKFFIKNME